MSPYIFKITRQIMRSSGLIACGTFLGYGLATVTSPHPQSQSWFGSFLPVAHATTAQQPPALLPTLSITLPSVNLPTNPNINHIARFGAPSYGDNVKVFDNYMMVYDRRCRMPLWVLEHLTPDILNGDNNRTEIEFYEDLSEHPFFRASNDDYRRSGYDRGHLAAAGNYRYSKEACRHTFILSNIAPQVGKGFNRHAWNHLEKYVRHLGRKNRNTYVCTGPLFLPKKDPISGKTVVQYEVIGNNNVAVPTHFFKVVLIEDSQQKYHLLAFLLPNVALPENVNLNQFLVPVEAIERAAGFLMFSGFPRHMLASVNQIVVPAMVK